MWTFVSELLRGVPLQEEDEREGKTNKQKTAGKDLFLLEKAEALLFVFLPLARAGLSTHAYRGGQGLSASRGGSAMAADLGGCLA